jgi:hypothetical protein
VIDLAERQNRPHGLGLVGRALAAVQRMDRIMETRNCSPKEALAELATSEVVVDPRIMRAMSAASTDGRA